jgi:hypothetical protein
MEFSIISLPRERDQVLIEIFFAEDHSPETIRSLGRCRGALEAIFLSDITTADGRYLEKIVFNPGSKNTKLKFKFPCQYPSNKDWNSCFNFGHNFTMTGDKLKVPLGNWIHPTHCIWRWYYRAQDNNLQRINEGRKYHYKLLMGHPRTRTTKMYHLVQEEPYISDVILGLPTSISGLSNLQVVKLNKGPALAGVPEKIMNLSDFLYSWGGTWMWEGIDNNQTTEGDVTWIAEGMRNNLLIWVSNGSYDRKKAKELSGIGWIIFCTQTGLRLTGTF